MRADKYAAHYAIQRAQITGQLVYADTQRCAQCDARAMDWHHYRGYTKAHRLDVEPLCRSCHGRAHRTAPAHTARNRRLIASYLAGRSLREVGAAFGLTYERVRQILKSYAVERRARGLPAVTR